MPRKASKDEVSVASSRLRIGAVSRLTRIPVDTLRAWERRYGVVAPNREMSAVRLYDQDDVARLASIKRLVDSGHAIGSVANLSRDELHAMSSLHDPVQRSARERIEATQVACFADSVSKLDSRQALDDVTVLGHFRSWSAFETAVLEHSPEALLIEIAALMPERVDEILRLFWRSRAVRVVVCYGFSPAALVRCLEAEGLITLQSPVSHAQIVRELRRAGAPVPARAVDVQGAPEPRVFDDVALTNMASSSSSIECECPHHLVGIIRMLNEFEIYSASCGHRNSSEAAVHAMLRSSTAHARVLMERALLEVAVVEGLQIPENARPA